MILALMLALVVSANPALAQTADETSLVRSVTTSFFEAYQRKDADGLITLWSTKAPELAAFTAEVRQKVVIADGFEMKRFEIQRVTVSDTSATVRVKVELQATELKAGQPVNALRQLNRTLRLVKEDGRWKVWQYEPAERELASHLLSAKTENERSALLAAEPDLVTVELVQSLRKQAETLNQRRELSQALIALQLTRSIAERLGDEQNVAFAVYNLGVNHYSRGEYQQALELFEQHLSLEAVKRDRATTARTLNSIGTTKRAFGDTAGALDYVQRSRQLAEEAGDKKILSNALNNLGVLHRDQGNYALALEYFEKSLALNEALGDKVAISLSLNNIGTIHGTQGSHSQALAYFQRALKLGQATDDKAMIANAVNNIGLTYYRHQHEDKLPPYIAMVELAFDRNRPGDALTYGELAKARTLLDVLRNGRIPINKAMSVEEQEKERISNAELTALNVQIYDERQRPKPNLDRIAELEPRREKARLAHEAFLTSLYVKHPELKMQRGEVVPITTAEAAALIPDPSTAIVEFVVADDKSYLIVLTGDRRKAAKITLYPIKITSNQLSQRVNEFRRMLAERDLGYQDKARQLYDLLLEPAEEQLRGKKTLCVVPDRALLELPFQALQPRTGVHLIEDHTLFYAPSLSVLREVMKQRNVAARNGSPSNVVKTSDRRGSSSRQLKTLLAFGNPQLSGGPSAKVRGGEFERFGPLPEAEEEVKTLAQLYGAANSQIFIGSEAREAVVKNEAPKYAVLHFATHGLLDDSNPMFSYLTLAQTSADPNEDGLLEAREIINMDLHAKLAVLSACQTARGSVGNGEGVIGMSWALFVAGVPTTVASQWKVDSASTTTLMIDFHRRLTTRPANAPKAEALRQASLGLLRSERYRHPFYWAGFVMIGDGW